MQIRIKTGAVALAFAATAALTACSASVEVGGPDTLKQADVEETVAQKFEEQTGGTADEVSCPDDLEAKADASMTCDLTSGGETQQVKVTITSVEDGKAQYNIESVVPE
ncbi:DUF4333 domain-containing protein [Nocardioides sp.]|uniref:DUF4333 domain-containing protein n=1 Tax=Nocardioides sp. TaxID=35761 RepID=UPI0035184DED